MKTAKIILLCQALSKEDDKRFRVFLKSPYFNQRKDLIKLYTLIRKHPLSDLPEGEKKQLLKSIYPQKPYDAQTFRTLSSLLNKQVETFLVYEEREKEEENNQLTLLRIFREKRLDRHFTIQEKKLEKKLQSLAHQNETWFEHQWKLNVEKYKYLERQRRTDLKPLEELSNLIDLQFLTRRFRYSTLLQAYRNVYRGSGEAMLLDSSLKAFEGIPKGTKPAIDIYYNAYCCLRYPDQAHFFDQLQTALTKHGQLLPPEERRDVYLAAINYCIRKLNAGSQIFARKGLDLFQTGLEQKALLDEFGHLSKFSYRNGFAMALRLNEYDWAEAFLERYQVFLPPAERSSIYHFNLSKLRYEQGRLSEGAKLLIQVDDNDLLLNLAAKCLLAKIYYESQELDALDSLLESFRIYILRKKPLGYHRENYLNFVRFCKKLVQLNPFDQEARTKLKVSILETKVLTEQDWFIVQLD